MALNFPAGQATREKAKGGAVMAAALSALTLAAPCFADTSVSVKPENAASLVDRCRVVGNPMRVECSGYILGVFDQMSVSRLICPPNNLGGGTAQAVAVALKYLKDHPEKWDQHPVFLIGESFVAAFPCGN